MQSDVVELCALGDWMLGAETNNGQMIEHRLYLVTDLSPSSLPQFGASIAEINRSLSLGRGYELQAFQQPCMGCEISVQPGWELSSPAMRSEFMRRFIQVINQEAIDHANANG